MRMQSEVILFADPKLGVASPSWRLRCCLEADGVAVFWFTPSTHPWLFENGRVITNKCGTFLGLHRDAALVTCDGILLSELESVRSAVFDFDDSAPEGFVLRRREGGGDVVVGCFSPEPDDMLIRSVVANGQIPVVDYVMIGDYSEAAASIACQIEELGFLVAAIGEGWPDRFLIAGCQGAAFYCLSRAAGVILVGDDLSATDLFCVNLNEKLSHGMSFRYQVDFEADRKSNSSGPLASVEGLTPLQDKGEPNPPAFYSDALKEKLLSAANDGSGTKASDSRYVVLLGYVGAANFGDELILSSVGKAISSRLPHGNLLAVSENPEHTFCERGVYPLSLSDKVELNHYLRRASLSLVVAGLLFDQGIRWTCGKNELFSSVIHSDLPGIVAFNAMSFMNGVHTDYYGIGAGPLALRDGHALLRMASRFDASFFTRDANTYNLLETAGVEKSLLSLYADVAFAIKPMLSEGERPFGVRRFVDEVAGPYVFVSLREYDDVPSCFAERVAHALDALLGEDEEISVVFGLLDPCDSEISNVVIANMRNSSRCHVFSSSDDLDSLRWLMENAECGVAMRYHCALLMSKAGCPCVGLGYLPKVEALYSQLGLADRLCLPVSTEEEALKSAVIDVFRNKVEIVDASRAAIDSLVSLATEAEGRMLSDAMAGQTISEGSLVPEEVYYFDKTGTDRHIDQLLEEKRRAEFSERKAVARLSDQLERNEFALKKLEDDFRRSVSWRIGRVITYVPRLLKRILLR